MEKFKLSHLVLYAKGWYLRTDDIFSDLKKILELDNYTPFNNKDVYMIIVHAVEDYDSYWTNISSILDGISPTECWKYDYYVKEHNWNKADTLEDYNVQKAFIKYVISNLVFLDNKQWNVVRPKIKSYPRAKHITIKKVYEQFIKK